MIRILCYGDSNTWGYIPAGDGKRYDENTRWTKLLSKALGNEFEIIEEGMCSRTLASEDAESVKELKNGYTLLSPIVRTHDKFDIFVLMLGTNDLKASFKNSPQTILEHTKKYIDFVTNYQSKVDATTPKFVLMGIAPVDDTKGFSVLDTKFAGATKLQQQASELIKNYAEKNGICYVDNSDLEAGADGLHLTAESHKKIANKLTMLIKEMNL